MKRTVYAACQLLREGDLDASSVLGSHPLSLPKGVEGVLLVYSTRKALGEEHGENCQVLIMEVSE